MLSENRNNLTSSFLIGTTLISFSFPVDMAKNSRTILKSNGKSGYPYLALQLSTNPSSFSTFSMILVVGLSYIVFILLR